MHMGQVYDPETESVQEIFQGFVEWGDTVLPRLPEIQRIGASAETLKEDCHLRGADNTGFDEDFIPPADYPDIRIVYGVFLDPAMSAFEDPFYVVLFLDIYPDRWEATLVVNTDEIDEETGYSHWTDLLGNLGDIFVDLLATHFGESTLRPDEKTLSEDSRIVDRFLSELDL